MLGAVAGGFLYKLGPERLGGFGKAVLMIAIGYLTLVLLGLLSESVYAWIKRRRRKYEKPPDGHKRTPCTLVEIEVDSYEFEDKVGKDFEPETAFQDGQMWAKCRTFVQFNIVELFTQRHSGESRPDEYATFARSQGSPAGSYGRGVCSESANASQVSCPHTEVFAQALPGISLDFGSRGSGVSNEGEARVSIPHRRIRRTPAKGSNSAIPPFQAISGRLWH